MDEHRIRHLYREQPEGFISARDALVREMKEAGEAEDAAAVKKLRKPTVPAWAVNQLADRDAAGIDELLDAGAEVRAAQQAAMSSGAGADRLRAATTARRDVVSRLARSAAEALRGAGRSPDTHLEEIRSTLEAGSVDAEAGERLRSGTLDRAIQETGGFGEAFGLQLVPEGASSAPRKAGHPTRPATPKEDTGRLRRDAAAADRKARQTRERADRLAAQIQEMTDRLQELTTKHAEAESSALLAELEAKRAAEALRGATS